MSKNIVSPITNSNHVKLLKSIDVNEIIILYKNQLKIDVSKYFINIKKVEIYECLDTGYRFYYPLNLDGDSKFYEELAKLSWYYMPWKWEHDIAKNIIDKKDKVLEIGSGYGDFISNLTENGFNIVGLELNEKAPMIGKKKGITIYNQTIQNFSLNTMQRFDVICTFQVLEHIANVSEFINAALSVLKPRGKFIISVPNNESLIIKTNDLIPTNAPPHHLGLWDHNSLIKLHKYFNLSVESILFEPLQKYHEGYLESFLQNSPCLSKESSRLEMLPYLKNIFSKNKNNHIKRSVTCISPYIHGHTVMAVYSKNDES